MLKLDTLFFILFIYKIVGLRNRGKRKIVFKIKVCFRSFEYFLLL